MVKVRCRRVCVPWAQTFLTHGWDQGVDFALAMTSSGLPRIGLDRPTKIELASTADGNTWSREDVELVGSNFLALALDPLDVPHLLTRPARCTTHPALGPGHLGVSSSPEPVSVRRTACEVASCRVVEGPPQQEVVHGVHGAAADTYAAGMGRSSRALAGEQAQA
ncbi:MAG: hypothetical protein HY901_32315 [Deltaproteobacteria bacterium]|nr:hypothetical protein [Deltaproteobacteria bacterium]